MLQISYVLPSNISNKSIPRQDVGERRKRETLQRQTNNSGRDS